MSRRAASLVVLAGFFTLATGLLVAQAPRKAINPKRSVELLQARMR